MAKGQMAEGQRADEIVAPAFGRAATHFLRKPPAAAGDRGSRSPRLA